MPYDYRHVRDAYDTLKDAGIVSESLPDWSAKMNEQTGSDDYAAGLHDDWIKQGSVAVDRLLEATGLPQVTGAIGRGMGELVGNPEAGERIGRGLPRMGVSMAPLAIPGLQWAAPLTMAASAGTEAYTETGSPAAGVIAAGTAGLMPAAGNIARQAALKGLGAELVGGAGQYAIKGGAGATVDEALAKLGQGAATTAVKEYVPTTFGQAAGAWGAENLGAAAVGEAGNLAGALYSGQDYHFSPTEQLLNLTLGQAPFAGASLVRHGLAGFGGEAARRHIEETKTNIDLTGQALTIKHAAEEAAAKTPVESIPETDYGTPEELLARNTRINDLRAQQRAAVDEGTSFSEADRQKMLDEEEGLVKAQGYQPGNILGANIDRTTPRRAVVGTEVAYDPELKFRRVQLSDDPANGELAGKQIGFSTEHEPPVAAPGTFSVPEGYHSEFLPTEGARFDPEAKLNIAQQKLTAAKSNAELQQAIIDLNHARQSYGMPALDDRMLSARTIEMKLGGIRDAAQSELERTRQIAKAKDEGAYAFTGVEAAKASQQEIAAKLAGLHPEGPVDRKRTERVANAPMNKENAPIKDKLHENAVRLVESSTLTDSKEKFLTWTQFGQSGLGMKYNMNEDATAKFMEQPEVTVWRDQLERSLAGGMNLQEYGERYLKNTGVSAEQAKAQTDRAVALAERPPETMVDGLLSSRPVQPEVTKAQGEMQTALVASPEAQERLKGRLDELKHPNIDELYNDMVRGGPLDHEVLDQLDTEVADYLYAKARDHQQTLDVLNAAAAHKDVPVESAPDKVATAAIKEILKNGEGRARAAVAADGLSAAIPATFWSKVYEGRLADPLSVVGDALKFAKDWFKNINYLAATGGPEMKEYAARSKQLESNIRKMETETLKTFWLDDEGKSTSRYVDSLKNPAVKSALNKYIDINMRRGQATDSVQMVPPDDLGVARALKGLSEEQKANVIALMNRVVSSNKVNAAQTLEKMGNVAVTEGARILNPVMGLKTQQNVALAKAVMDMMEHPEVPEAVQQGQMALQRIADKSFDKVAELQDHFTKQLEEINGARANFEKNPAQVTQEMYGNWDVTYKKNGREYFTRVDTRAAAQGLGDEIVNIRRNDSDGDTPVDYRARGAVEPTMWFDNHFTSAKKNASYWSRTLFKAQKNLLRDSAEISQRPDLQRMVDMHAENMLVPDPPAGKAMTRLASMWYLGGNVASAIANGTQMLTRGAAAMTRLTGNPIDSYKRVLAAVREVGEGALDKSKWRSPDHQWLIDKYELDKSGSAYDVAGERENNITLKMKWALNHGRPQSVAQKGDSMLHRVNDLLMTGYRAVENVNTKSAMLSAFDFYRSVKGGSLDKEEAYRKAEEFNAAVNDVGGKANRPILAFHTMPKSAALVMNSLQSFNIGTVGQIAKLIKESWPGGTLTPAEKWNARKATAQLFAVQGTLAGVMGIPFASSLVAGLELAFPNLELQKNIRTLAQKFFQEDDDHDTPLSDLAMNGVPSMFGWDFQSRLSMGNTLPGVSEINGFQPDIMHAAPVQILTKFIQGGQKLIDKDFMGAAKDMAPPAVSKILQAAFADGKVLDYSGKPIAGGDRTWGELTGQVLGFQPTRLSDYYEMNRIIKHSNSQHAKLTAKFHEDVGQDILRGDFGTAAQKLRDKAAQDDKYKILDGGKKAVEAAMEKYFPRDLRQKLNKNDTQIARLLPVNYGLPSEVERQQFRNVALRQLGIPVKREDLMLYTMRDRVAAENPEFTKEEVYSEAERRLNRAKRPQALAATAEDASVAQTLP